MILEKLIGYIITFVYGGAIIYGAMLDPVALIYIVLILPPALLAVVISKRSANRLGKFLLWLYYGVWILAPIILLNDRFNNYFFPSGTDYGIGFAILFFLPWATLQVVLLVGCISWLFWFKGKSQSAH